MKKTVYPGTLIGEITPPPSKSISHRALILAAFSNPGTKIYHVLKSEDVDATRQGLTQMGAAFKKIENGYEVIHPVKGSGNEIDCHNSGTTLRLLTGVSCLFEGKTTLFGDNSLITRPMSPLVEALRKLGAKIELENGTAPIEVVEPVKDSYDKTSIEGKESSQFISSLLILAALRKGQTTIEIIPPLVSKPYIKLTLEMLHEGGIKIEDVDHMYHVHGSERLGFNRIEIPVDASSMAFFAVAGALPGNRIIIKNAITPYTQADAKILDFIQMAGAQVEMKGNDVIIQGNKLKAIEVDISDCPDLFPILCVLGANAEGSSRFYNAKHLRLKETDRIETMLDNLKRVNIKVEELEDGAIITGGPIHGNVTLDSFKDHRIAMATAILARNASDKIDLQNAEAVAVSYPNFFEDLKRLSQNS